MKEQKYIVGTKLLLLSGFALLLMLSSCSIEKRLYMEGYQIVWHKKTSNPLIENSTETKSKRPYADSKQIQITKNPEGATNNPDTFLVVSDENFTASIDETEILLHTNTKAFSYDNKKVPSEQSMLNEPKKTANHFRSNSHIPEKQERGFSIIAIIGFMCSLAAVFLIIFPISYFLPPVFTLIGSILSASGIEKTGHHKKRGKGLAIAGFVLGMLQIVFYLFALMIIAILFFMMV